MYYLTIERFFSTSSCVRMRKLPWNQHVCDVETVRCMRVELETLETPKAMNVYIRGHTRKNMIQHGTMASQNSVEKGS